MSARIFLSVIASSFGCGKCTTQLLPFPSRCFRRRNQYEHNVWAVHGKAKSQNLNNKKLKPFEVMCNRVHVKSLVEDEIRIVPISVGYIYVIDCLHRNVRIESVWCSSSDIVSPPNSTTASTISLESPWKCPSTHRKAIRMIISQNCIHYFSVRCCCRRLQLSSLFHFSFLD